MSTEDSRKASTTSPKSKKKPTTFIVRIPGGRWVRVDAWTKGEARAMARKEFGLVRLPAGTTTERL